jgi:hypothetical protein
MEAMPSFAPPGGGFKFSLNRYNSRLDRQKQ